MNRSKVIFLLLAVFYLVVGMAACSKKKTPSSIYGWVEGKWKLSKTATDNGNGVLGAFLPVSKEQNWVWTINGDGTATELNNYDGSPNLAINYAWRIKQPDSIWMATSGAGHDTTTYLIKDVNSAQMVLTWTSITNGVSVVNGYTFEK